MAVVYSFKEGQTIDLVTLKFKISNSQARKLNGEAKSLAIHGKRLFFEHLDEYPVNLRIRRKGQTEKVPVKRIFREILLREPIE